VNSVSRAIATVLQTPDPQRKVMLARKVARNWRLGRLTHDFDVPMPARPSKPEAPILLQPAKMPKRRSGGTRANRIALLHALAHIEFSAIDLAFDMAGRFGNGLPRAFIDDWLGVGADEAMHFALLDRRLRALGSYYGALPAHDGLWEAAESTSYDVGARLAIVPLVLEARGLDVSPSTINRLKSAGDLTSAAVVSRIYHDEIRHVTIGQFWFATHCESLGFSPIEHFQRLVGLHFKGSLKPPFNDSARLSAGLTLEYYSPLAS
jgi:uncharacterized ferritin-like protein (DUF455 family)